MQPDQPVEFVGQMRAPFRFADREGLFGAVVGAGQVVDARQQCAELLAIGDDAADCDAAKADAVIAALAADQPHPRSVAAHVMVGERDFQRGIDRFRAGIAEKHVVEVARRQRGNAAGQLKGLGMGELECRRVVELGRLALDRLDDRIAVMPGIGAPEAGRAVEHISTIGCNVVHVLCARDQPRARLEGAIGGERHPERLEVVGDTGGDGRSAGRHGCCS